MTTPPTAPSSAPTYTAVTASSVTLNNVPGLGATTPISISVEGAGYAPANGDYLPVTGANATLNGQPQYTNGSCSMYYSIGWNIDSHRAVTAPSNFADGSAGYLYTAGSTGSTLESAFPPAGTSWTNVGDYGPGLGSSPPTAVTPDYGSEATSLNIQRALDSGFTTGLATFTGVTPSTDYTDSTVSAGTPYYYRYVEVNAGGASPGPGESVTTSGSPPPPPPSPPPPVPSTVAPGAITPSASLGSPMISEGAAPQTISPGGVTGPALGDPTVTTPNGPQTVSPGGIPPGLVGAPSIPTWVTASGRPQYGQLWPRGGSLAGAGAGTGGGGTGGGPSALAADTDVAIASPQDGQVLTYSAAAGKWVNGATPLPATRFYATLCTGD